MYDKKFRKLKKKINAFQLNINNEIDLKIGIKVPDFKRGQINHKFNEINWLLDNIVELFDDYEN